MSEYAKSWVAEERRFRLMGLIGRRMLETGEILFDRTRSYPYTDVRIVKVKKFGYIWRIVQVDGMVSEITKVKLAPEQNELPSRYWEPQPDEDDLERMASESSRIDLELPFE